MALTNAEKQARWRAKRDAETERLRNAAEAAPSAELIEARKEIERLRNEVAALKAGTPDRPQPRPLPRTPEEWAAALQAAEEERKAKRAGARLARAAARAAPAEDEATLQEKLEKAEKQLAANKTRMKEQQRKYNHMKEWYAAKQPSVMPFETFGKVSRCLRQENGPPTAEERDDALKRLNLWRSEEKKGGRGL